VISCADGLGIAEVGTVCVVVWRAVVTADRFQRQRDALYDLVDCHPEGVGLLCVIEPNTPPLEDRMRRASIDMVEGLGTRLRCITCVIEGSGFRAAATRSILSGMALLLSKVKSDVKFTATVVEAARVVAQHCDAVSTAQLIDACEQVRTRLSAG
jgi:hypothetical protein